MFITKFTTMGIPKATYNADGVRTGEADRSVTFSVLDTEGHAVGKFTLLDTANIAQFKVIEVTPEEYEGRKYFTFVQGWKTVAEFDAYASSYAGLPEATKKATAVKHLTA